MVHVHSRLIQPNSLHPKIATLVDLKDTISNEGLCQLDIIYVLPPSVFVDPYQLKDLQETIGKATLFGEHDLELPLEKIKETRGSIVFLRQTRIQPKWQLELPLHLRYQQPSIHTDHQTIHIESPYAGWTCGNESQSWPPLSDEYSLLPSIQANSASFIKLSGEPATLNLTVPIGKVQDASVVTFGTFGAVVLCACWIIYSVGLSIKKRRRTEAKGKRRKSE
ncbi:PIG-X [Parasitella parasitica]|nr:PIG-X [Parasitella parasitica]